MRFKTQVFLGAFGIIICTIFLVFTFVLTKFNLFDIKAGTGDGSIQAYYISLEKAEDRRKRLLPLLEKLRIPFEWIVAVYGKELPRPEKDKVTDKEIFRALMGKNIVDGEIGCYLSHLKAWKTFLQSKHSYALIIEDDASFNPVELNKVVNELIANNDKWDYVNLDPWRTTNARAIKNISDKFCLMVPKQRVWLTTCQLINRKAAASLIQRALPIKMPVDHFVYRSWELGYKFRTVEPKIVRQIGNDTYIQQNRNREIWYLYIPSHIFRITGQIMTIIMGYVK